jgi:hypothetical protein
MTDPNTQPSPDSLQFDRAVHAEEAPTSAPEGAGDMECASCKSPIKKYYYHVDGAAVCAKCKQAAADASGTARGAGALFKAFLFGGVAAVLGAAIYYGVIALTNFEIGIVAIAIGFMVGFGVRMGASGGGGRRFQVMALLLTYFAVGLAYTPLAIKGAMESDTFSADSMAVADTVAESAISADSLTVTLASADTELLSEDGDAIPADSLLKLASAEMSFGKAILGLAIIGIGGFLMVFALPVIAVVGSLPSGLISAFIIGIGMQQAWKMTAGHTASISGPYKVGGDAAHTPAEPQPEP